MALTLFAFSLLATTGVHAATDAYGECTESEDLFEGATKAAQLRGFGNSRGVNLNDFDGDGLIDIYLARAPSRVEGGLTYAGDDLLFINQGDGTFEEASEAFGFGDHCEDRAPMFGDLDNDGDNDLYVTVNGQNVLYRNNGETFVDDTAWAGAAGHIAWGHQGALLDVDRDGYLDIVFTNGPEDGSDTNALLMNQRDGTFVDASAEVGFAGVPSGKGLCVLDADLDGWPDVFVTTGPDYGNHLFMNQGDGTFVDEAVARGVYDPLHRFGVGANCGDIDNDGDADIFLVTHDKTWTGNQLFENLGDGTFVDIATEAGVVEPVDPHGSAFVDFNLDGFLDLVLSGIGVSPQLFVNNGDQTFDRLCHGAGVVSKYPLTWAIAAGDVDEDGWPDLYIAHGLGRRALDDAFYRNLGGTAHYLTVEARGTSGNPSALGAKVEVSVGDDTITRWVGAWSSFDSQGPLPISFGLGENESVDSVRVTFTSGVVVEVTAIQADQRITLTEPNEVTDTDLDGVADGWDECPQTSTRARTDAFGCAPGQRSGIGVATTYPARDDIVTDAPTFEWTTNATDAQAVVQVSWDGTFGPAARLDFGPTTSRSITADDERWQQLLEEWDGVRPLLWRVMLNEADGATGTSAAQRFFAAVPTQVIHIPNGVNVFAPSHIVIDQGQSVTWWNDSVAAGNLQSESHDVQLFNEHGNAITAMEELNSSSSFTWTFDEVGRWNALCHRHSGAGLADAPTMEGEHAHRGAGPYHCMSSSVTIR